MEKDEMRNLAKRGGPYSDQERNALLDYCESDVDALYKLLHDMNPFIDIHRALIRGRFMKAAAMIEFNGIPIDTETQLKLDVKWDDIQDELIREIDASYGVYNGQTFKTCQFEK